MASVTGTYTPERPACGHQDHTFEKRSGPMGRRQIVRPTGFEVVDTHENYGGQGQNRPADSSRAGGKFNDGNQEQHGCEKVAEYGHECQGWYMLLGQDNGA